MIQNSIQEAQDREKEKPKIRKARKAQKEHEKGMIFAPVKDSFGNMKVLTKPCLCGSKNIEKIDWYFHCKKCETNYKLDSIFNIVKLPEKI